MVNYFNFKNKKVLIMGGSSGFGAKMAEVFNSYGANVFIVARNEKKLKKVVSKCKFKNKIKYFVLDVNDNKTIDIFLKKLKKDYRYLNIILFCCGIKIRSRFDQIKESDFQKVFNTNFISSVNFYKKVLPLIKDKKIPSRIINFTSIF